MPRFIIERNFAEELELAAWEEGNDRIERINDEEGVKWIFSFLSADKRKTYCLYEASDADAIRRAAARANIPADVITMVDEVNPAMFA
ncbi:nickel-binding protein [Rhodospirillaceae bacterium SYSU D60014]|uniref:nickel-binding protein n=1 Tax=Virgifigura deserti TaxID=2268457 RepID=UPI000E66B78C